MKKLFILIVLAANCILAYTQEKCDTIFSNNGKLIVQIKEITPESVIYQYPGETFTNSIYKNSINKIIYSSGRTEIFNDIKKGNSVKSGKDWEKVAITSLESEILGLNKIGEVTTRAKGGSEFANVDKIKDKAYKKLKIEAAMQGANTVLLLTEHVEGNRSSFFAENATETNLTGIAYTNLNPSFAEFKKLLDNGNEFKYIETQYLVRNNDVLDIFIDKKENNVFLNSASEESGQIKVKAQIPKDDNESFSVIYFDEHRVTLMYKNTKKICNVILERK